MIKIKNVLGMFVVLAILLTFIGCGKNVEESSKSTLNGQEKPMKKVVLTVSSGAGLKDAMNELKEIYEKANEGVSITYNFAASGSLQQQIENGADVDLFISAAQKQMDALKEKGLLEEDTRKNLVANSLVLIVPKDSSTNVTFEELGKDKIKKLAMGEPKSVPAGQYAEEVLKTLNIYDAVKPKAIYAKDVREVLTWVETGNVDAGIVYETDAKASQKVQKVADAPEGSHKPIVYPASVIKESKNKEAAKAFLNFLSSEKGKVVFEKLGFKFLEK